MLHSARRLARLSCVLLIGLVVTGSLPSQAQEAPTDAEKAWGSLSTMPRDQRLAVLEREAKREGSVVVYGALGIDRARLFLAPFEEKYAIKAEFVRLTEPELADKVLLEHRTGRVNADIGLLGSNYHALLADALGSYRATTWDDFDPRFRAGGPPNKWAALTFELLPHAIAWRTDRVKPGEAPKTLDDVANPKWKGRAGTTTHLETFIDAMVSHYGESAGMDKVQRLAALDNRLYRSIAALYEALSTGEIDIAWLLGAYRAVQLKEKGAPVDFVFQEPLTAVAFTVASIRGARHPYAAALFMEYLTDARTLERLDKLEGGRVFGNRKGTYTNALSQFPTILISQAIPPDRFRQLNRTAQQLFIRR
jgi:iron(III) transport system substrate-binding protein